MDTLLVIFLVTGTVNFSLNVYIFFKNAFYVLKARRQMKEWGSPEQQAIREMEQKKAYEEQMRVAMKVARDMREGEE